ncbi:MAG: HlyD family efflux transporter periplasmic adaptor subunit [Saprospiraceae bacterium]|nr:HlyD family efflux transporter periplasmic adaptor subunit [Saprospiraceae bacterium]
MRNISRLSRGSFVAIAFLLGACQQTETTLPVRKTVEDAVFASGYMEQENIYTVSAKADGILLSFPIQEGDSVQMGDLIAIIENDVQHNQLRDALAVHEDAVADASPDSPQLQQLQTQIEQAKKQLAFDQENHARYQKLKASNSISQLDFEKVQLQYQNAQSNLEGLQKNYEELQNSLKLNQERSLVQVSTQRTLLQDYKLTTEQSGQVIKVFKKQGELVRRGEAVARISSGDYLIKLFVAEDDITKVDVGQAVAVHINTYPNSVFPARITKIHPGFDEAEQSYIVEAQFDQLPNKMFSGTQLQANIEIGSRKNVLVIPSEYVSKGSFVRLETGEEIQIETGSKNELITEVVSGLTDSDVLVKPKQ